MLSLQEEKEAALQSEQAAQAAEKIALEADQRSISIRQNVAPELLNYARSQYLLHRYRKAETLTKKALESDPKLEPAKIELIFQLFALHEFEQCLKIIKELNNEHAVRWLKESCSEILSQPEADFLKTALPHKVITAIDSQNQTPFLETFKIHFLLISTYKYPQADRLNFAKEYLRKMTVKDFNFKVYSLHKNFISLSIAGNKGIHDITVLNNLPISELDLSHTDIHKIRVLNSLPLTTLNLSHTHIENLHSLKDLPLKKLNLWQSNVRSLNHLENTPLESLITSGKWADLSPLKKIKSLKQVYVSRYTYSNDYIKEYRKHFDIIFID